MLFSDCEISLHFAGPKRPSLTALRASAQALREAFTTWAVGQGVEGEARLRLVRVVRSASILGICHVCYCFQLEAEGDVLAKALPTLLQSYSLSQNGLFPYWSTCLR